jgi:tetratricopeptide (TPR) repeat protein
MKRAAGDFIAAGKAGSDGRAYGYAAYCLSVGKEPSGAIAAADAAIRLGYRTAPVYANRAYNHLHLARLPKAKEDCDEALRLDPDLLAARYSRAYAHLQMRLQNGEGAVPPEAIADVDRVTASEPTDPDVWNVAAQLYVLAPGGPAMDKAAHAVRKAVRAGKPPDALRRSEVLRPLAGHPIYEEALTLLPGRAVKLASPHLVNPIP